MLNRTVSRVVWISARYPHLTIRLAIQVNTPGSAYGSVGVHMNPDLIPEHLLDELFSNGIASGINVGVVDAKFPLSSSDVEVEILALDFSDPVDTFNEKEVKTLSNELRVLTHGVIVDVLTNVES